MNGGNKPLKIDRFENLTSEILTEQGPPTFAQKAAQGARSAVKGVGQLAQATGLTKEAPFQLAGALGSTQQKYSNDKKYYPNILQAGGLTIKKPDVALKEFEVAVENLKKQGRANIADLQAAGIVDKVESPDKVQENNPRIKQYQTDIQALETELQGYQDALARISADVKWFTEAAPPAPLPGLPPKMNPAKAGQQGVNTGLDYASLAKYNTDYTQALKDRTAELQSLQTAYDTEIAGFLNDPSTKPPLPGDTERNFTVDGTIYVDKWEDFIDQVKDVITEASRKGYSAGASLYEIFQKYVYSGYSDAHRPRRGAALPVGRGESLSQTMLANIHQRIMYPLFVAPKTGNPMLLYIPIEDYNKLATQGGMIARGAKAAWNTFQSMAGMIPKVKL